MRNSIRIQITHGKYLFIYLFIYTSSIDSVVVHSNEVNYTN